MLAAVLDGIVGGLQFGLLAVGLTLLYGLGGVLNLAHGAIAVAAAIVAALAIEAGLPAGAAVGLGILAATAIGLALDRTLMRPVYRLAGEARVLLSLLLTLGTAFVIDGVLGARYPNEALSLRVGSGSVPILGVPMRTGSLVASGIALVTIVAVIVFLRVTMTGRAVRSVIQDEEGARLVGVNPARVRTLIFGLGSALAGLVAVTQSMTSPVTVTSGLSFTILALIVTVVGGLGSASGALLAGVLLGIVHALSAFYIGAYHLDHAARSRSAHDPRTPLRAAREVHLMGSAATSPTGTASVVGDAPAGGRSPLLAYAPVALAGVLLALPPLAIGDSRTYMGLATTVLVFACYATAFNVIFGCTGQLFLCVGALAGVAGYGSAILGDRAGLPLPLTIPLATVAVALLGALFSWVSVRRSLDVIFTGIVTLTFSLGFGNLLLGQRAVTGGETGLVVTAGEGTLLGERVPAYYVFLAVLVLMLAVFRWLQRSHYGWAFRALRDDEMTAELAGVDVARYRVAAGFAGSAMLGLVGALNAHAEGFISPSTYAFTDVDVPTLLVLAFGGIGTLTGPVIGAVAFGVIDELLRDLGEYRVAVYGAVLIALFLGLRRGVGPAVGALARRIWPYESRRA